MTIEKLLNNAIENAQRRFESVEMELKVTTKPEHREALMLIYQERHGALNALADLRSELIGRGLL